MRYKIYHSVGNGMFTEKLEQARQFVGTVNAESFEDAYMQSQNFQELWNKETPCRSTSVGDLIVCGEITQLVCGIGFREIKIRV